MCLIFCEQIDDSSASISLAQLTKVYIYSCQVLKKKRLLRIFKSSVVIYSWLTVVI